MSDESKLLNRLLAFVDQHTIIPELKEWSKSHYLPGIRFVSIYDLLKSVYDHIMKINLMQNASAISFNFILAFFPFTIFLLTLLPYFRLENSIDLLETSVEGLIPESVFSIVFGLIRDTIKPRGGLLSVGFLSAMFFASNGIMSLLTIFNDTELVQKTYPPNYVLRLKALLLTFVMIFLLLISSITFVMANQILAIVEKYITLAYFTKGFILSVRWIPLIILIYCILTVIYRVGPSLKKKIPIFSIGTLLSTLMVIIVSLLISYVVNNFANYNRIYGSLGTAVALMIWLQSNMVIILFGYEFNLVIMKNKLRSLGQRDAYQ